jgi:hypothetical protein
MGKGKLRDDWAVLHTRVRARVALPGALSSRLQFIYSSTRVGGIQNSEELVRHWHKPSAQRKLSLFKFRKT